MTSNLFKISKALLPFPLFYRLRKLYRLKTETNHPYKGQYLVRQDTVRFAPQPEIYLDVYWKVLPIGKGPAVALFIFDEEVLRFDCFGEGRGHFHARFVCFDNTKEQRIYFSEKTVEAQIERTIFELTHNLIYYLQRHPIALIRKVAVDQKQMQLTAEQVREKMLEYLHTVPALSDLKTL